MTIQVRHWLTSTTLTLAVLALNSAALPKNTLLNIEETIMPSRTGNIAIQVLLLFITVIVTSAVILALVQTGIISINADEEEISLLDTEFIPVSREGTLSIKEFQFCRTVDENYRCLEERDHFNIGEEVHFRFLAESSTSNGEVMLVENYRLKDPRGNVILDVDEKNNYHFEIPSRQKKESIAFRDYFVLYPGAVPGEYTLELMLENPLLSKKMTLTQKIFIAQP